MLRTPTLRARAGAHVPSLRPAEHATDSTPTDAVLQHAVDNWTGLGDDAVAAVVQVTSPFTTADDLVRTVDALRPDAACAITVTIATPNHAYLLGVGPDGLGRTLIPEFAELRTQDVPPLLVPTGAVCATRLSRVRRRLPLVADPVAPVLVAADRSLDIDDADGLRVVNSSGTDDDGRERPLLAGRDRREPRRRHRARQGHAPVGRAVRVRRREVPVLDR